MFPRLLKATNLITLEGFNEIALLINFNALSNSYRDLINNLKPSSNVEGDFVDMKENNLTPYERVIITTKYDDYWGKSWFMFSNPMYGDWEGSILDFNYGQPRDEKLKIKSLFLDVK